MTTYKAPLRDMQFVMRDLLNYEKHYQSLPDCDEVNQELIDAILDEASKFSEEVVAPLNAVGDEIGCQLLDDGEVQTPPGFKEAYQMYIDGGWPSLEQPSRYGGQGDVSRPFPWRRGHDRSAWLRRTEDHVPRAPDQRTLDRHDVPDRGTKRHGPRAHQDQG